jgi:uncharacterized protein
MLAAFLAIGLMQSPTRMSGRAQPATATQAGEATMSVSEIPQLEIKGEAGDVEAQVKLARAYQAGNGVSQNERLAAQWYRRAAEQGSAIAENSLGNMYRAGSGVEKDKQEAVSWYRKAARQKYCQAMFNLGTVYYNGDGVGIDDTLAYAWFLLAQRNDCQPANEAVTRMNASLPPSEVTETYLKVAQMLGKGDELPRDDAGAAQWYRKAADRGNAWPASISPNDSY